jgi:ABC-2 type transport system permease protein
MKSFAKSLSSNLRIELRRLRSAPLPVIVGAVMPVVAGLIIALALRNSVIRDVPVVIVDADRSSMSRTLIRMLDAAQVLAVTDVTADENAARQAVQDGRACIAVFIPEGMERDVKRGGSATVPVVTDGSQLLLSKVSYRTIATSIMTLSAGIQIRRFEAGGMTPAQAKARALPVDTQIHAMGNPWYDYAVYLVPGMLMALLQMSGCFSALWMFRRRREAHGAFIKPPESGKMAWALARILPIAVANIVAVLVMVLVLYPIAGIPMFAATPYLILIGVILVLVSMGMGALLSVVLPNMVTAVQAGLVINAPAFVFAGYTYPRWAMPQLIKFFAELLPLTHTLDAASPLFMYNTWTTAGLVPLAIMFVVLWGGVALVLYVPAVRRLFQRGGGKMRHGPVRNLEIATCEKAGRRWSGSAWQIISCSVKREWYRLVHDSNLILVVLVAPLAYPVLYGSIYLNKIESKVPVAVVDHDRSTLSRKLLRDIDAHQYVHVAEVLTDEDEMQGEMANGRVHACVVVPEDFSRRIKTGEPVSVHLFVSPGRLLVLSDVGTGISQAVSVFGGKVTASALAARGVPVITQQSYAQPLRFSFCPTRNYWLTYGDMILPLLLGIILIQLVFLGSGAATAREFTDRTLQGLPARRTWMVPLGKSSIYVMVFLIAGFIMMHTLVPWFDISIDHASFDLVAVSALAFAAASSMGMFVGSFFKRRITVFSILGFTSYPFFLLSGCAWPEQQLSGALKLFAMLFPSTPFLRAIQSLTQRGNGLGSISGELLNLAVLILAYGAAYAWRLRKSSLGGRRVKDVELAAT